MRRSTSLFTILTVMTFLLSAVTSVAAASSILSDRIAAVHGGADRIRNVTSLSLAGTVIDHLTAREGQFSLVAAPAGRVRIESFATLSFSGEIWVSGKEKGWRKEKDRSIPLTAAELKDLLATRFVFTFPAALLQDGGGPTYDDTAVIGGRPLERYRLTLSGAHPLTLSVDVVSGLVRFVDWIDSRDLHVSWELDDFRFTDGILFPHRFVRKVDGILSRTITVDRVVTNPHLPAGTFSP